MRIENNFTLENNNTFRLAAKARWFMEYDNEEELNRILRDEYFQECRSIHIGGGSNLLFVRDFDGIVVHSRIKGMEISEDRTDTVLLRIGAAEIWDNVVAFAVGKGWGGIENLSYIPGETGAAAVQNIGAYGAEIKDAVDSVETYNKLTLEKKTFSADECKYSYRNSVFKEGGGDLFIVTHVNLRLQKTPSFRLDYGNLREALGHGSATPTLQAVRDAVISVRRSKLPDPDELGSAGSFFMNPIVSNEQFEQLKKACPSIPSYPAPASGGVKLPAGWLIEQCGYKGGKSGRVGVYDKQALVIVNLGGATGDEIATFADEIVDAVYRKFGIALCPEVRIIE